MTDNNPEAKRREHFRIQAGHCERLGSPFTALVCRTLGERLDETSAFGRRALTWPLQTLSGDLLALRCCGALHYCVRCEPHSQLAEVYPPHPAPDADILWDAVRATIAAHGDALTQFLDTPPQTNEVSRTGIVLGGLLHVAGRWRMPLSLMEIGASAGLNLNLERFAYDLGNARHWGDADSRVRIKTDWRGDAPGLDTSLEIAARIGNDQSPLDVKNEDDRRRLLSYLWPDQTDRLKRIDAALAIASKHPVEVIEGDAAEFLKNQLAQEARPGVGRFVFHTIVLQYASKETRAAVKETLAEAGARASDKTPLARFSMEHEKPDQAATMRLTLWPGGEERIVGQCESHGAWAEWTNL